MDSNFVNPELAEVISNLREQLSWLDRHGYLRAAIDLNNVLEELSPSDGAEGSSKVEA